MSGKGVCLESERLTLLSPTSRQHEKLVSMINSPEAPLNVDSLLVRQISIFPTAPGALSHADTQTHG
jgi:hypothetical protein